jgi:hypothetical protein
MGYEHDFHDWAQEQADALRRRDTNALDYDNLAEEIESLGRSDRTEIRSRLEILLIHLLKWRYDPDGRCPSWRASIHEARHRIALIIEDSPSLRSFPGEALAKAWRYAARNRALWPLGMRDHDFPEACPWVIEEVLGEDFLP